MANRVTALEVKEILNDSTVSDAVVDTYIIGANALITKIFENDGVITTVMLKELERWLTAHLIVSTIDRMAKQEKLGAAEVLYSEAVVYFGVGSKMLSTTPYGRNVLILDFTGKMGKAGAQNATVFAIPSFE